MFKTFQYRPICEITFYHGYYLDNAETAFNVLSPDEQIKALKRYDFSEIFELVPLVDTFDKLKNYRILHTVRQHGIRLSIRTKNESGEPLISMNDNEFFVYALRIKDQNFLKYTESGISNTTMYLFTNDQPDRLKDSAGMSISLGEASVKRMPLTGESTLIDDGYLLSDVKIDIDTPSDTEIMTENYLNLSNKTGIIGFVYIRIKSSDDALSTLNGSGETRVDYPNFKIHFPTRQTYWKFKKEAIGFMAETKNQLSLSKYGYVEIDPETDFLVSYSSSDPEYTYKYPNPIPGNFEIQPASGSDPEKIYSVIFI